jgi:hypothetical protein
LVGTLSYEWTRDKHFLGDGPKQVIRVGCGGEFLLPGGSDVALEEDQIEPTIELEADLAEMADAFKAQALVEADGGGVFCVDAAD